MLVVDTNVLVYAADTDAIDHDHCRALLDRLRGQPQPWHVTWGIVYEFLRVVTHPRVFQTPWTLGEAWHFLGALLAAPSASVLVATRRHDEVLATIVDDLPDLRGNLLHDTHTAVLMREHGVRRIVTRDADFRRFEFLEVLDPLEMV